MGILTALAQQNPNQMCFKHSVCIKHPMQTKCHKNSSLPESICKFLILLNEINTENENETGNEIDTGISSNSEQVLKHKKPGDGYHGLFGSYINSEQGDLVYLVIPTKVSSAEHAANKFYSKYQLVCLL